MFSVYVQYKGLTIKTQYIHDLLKRALRLVLLLGFVFCLFVFSVFSAASFSSLGSSFSDNSFLTTPLLGA